METKNVILELRVKNGLSQEELAEKIYVTRQAVSRWENGETVPNIETLKLLSRLFDVSINTLLGSPRKLICQCCGMPLEGMKPQAASRTANLTKNIANGATMKESSLIQALSSLQIFLLSICQTKIGRRNRQEPILKRSCRSLITGNKKKNNESALCKDFAEGIFAFDIYSDFFEVSSQKVGTNPARRAVFWEAR